MTPLNQPLEKKIRIAHFSRNVSVVTVQNIRGAILQPAYLRIECKKERHNNFNISH